MTKRELTEAFKAAATTGSFRIGKRVFFVNVQKDYLGLPRRRFWMQEDGEPALGGQPTIRAVVKSLLLIVRGDG